MKNKKTVMRSWFAAFMAALRFLTIFPVPGSLGTQGKDLARSLPFFPLVGLILGTSAVCVARVCTLFLPAPVAVVFLVLALLSFSGGLHADGLADTADGFFSARPRERILEILRDSRIGAMGVLALIMVLALKITSLAALNNAALLKAAFLMPIFGRAAIVVSMALLPYARSEGGLATLFYERPVKKAALLALTVVLFSSLALFGFYGLIPACACLALVFIFGRWCRTKIGGATGDTLGAICELAEALVPVLLCLRVGNLS